MRVAIGVAMALLFAAGPASAQGAFGRPMPPPPPTPQAFSFAASDSPTDLRGRFGIDVARRLLRSTDGDDQLRGIERAAAIGSPEAIAELVQATDATGPRSRDARAWIALARGLAPYTSDLQVRAALLGLITGGGATSLPSARDAGGHSAGAAREDADSRVLLGRQIAAMALAASGNTQALDALVVVARGGGVGQSSALLALGAHPPSLSLASRAAPLLTPSLIELFARLGDVRALDPIRDATRSADSATRASALVALGEMGDERALSLARAALTDRDPRIRAAGADALVALDATDRAAAVEKLLGDESTHAFGVSLAERVESPGIVRALAARAMDARDPDLAERAVYALGTARSADAARALRALLGHPILGSDAADALARSPSASALGEIASASSDAKLVHLALRAYAVRASSRSERDDALDQAAARAAHEKNGASRALGVFVRLVLGDADLDAALRDQDPRVRRAAAAAALAGRRRGALDALLARLVVETDAPTRVVLGAGLLAGDARALVPTRYLEARARAGEADAPLAAMALGARIDDAGDARITALLASPDAVIRAHAVRGLAECPAPDASGLLAGAYAYEVDPLVRRQVIVALAARPLSAHGSDDARAPTRLAALRAAADLDPDAYVRFIAADALAANRPRGGMSASPPESKPLALAERSPTANDVTWIHLVGARGAPQLGRLLRADGLAVPIVFDDEGFALVPASPAGPGRLTLAPRVPSYEVEER